MPFTIANAILVVALSLMGFAANALNRDSVFRVVNNSNKTDSVRVWASCHLINDCAMGEEKLANNYFKAGLAVASKSKNYKLQGLVYGHYAGYFSERANNYTLALEYGKKAIDLSLKAKDYASISATYHFLARNIFERLDMVPEAIDAFKKAIHYAKKNKKDSDGYLLYELGWIETFNGYPDSAFVHLSRSLAINDPANVPLKHELLTWLGNTFVARKQHRKAIYYHLKAMHIADSLHNDALVGESNRYAANAYRALGIKDSSVLLLKNCVETYMNRKDDRLYFAASTLINWLAVDGRLKEAKQFIDLLDDGKLFDYTKSDEVHAMYLQSKYMYHYKAGEYKQAIEYLRTYLNLNDSIDARIKRYDLSEQNLKMNFFKEQETLKLNQQAKDLKLQAELDSQKTFAYLLTGIIGLVFLLLLLSVRNNRQKQAAYKEISIQKTEVERQKSLVEAKNKEVTDSIHYANRIQTALLAHKKDLEEFVPQHFIYFKPKDIVSGDFYWSTQVRTKNEKGLETNLFYLAVCDSTGHGVPGAFMSLLNMGFLSEAIGEKDIFLPNDVFTYVRNRLITTISQEQQKDGFDGILLSFDKPNMRVNFVAANNALIYCSNGVCQKLEYDRIPVGQSITLKEFTLRSIDVKPGDSLYLLTDGYADQFGGDKGRRFMSGNLLKLLASNVHLPMQDQLQLLDSTFKNWIGEFEQIDDICIVGIKL